MFDDFILAIYRQSCLALRSQSISEGSIDFDIFVNFLSSSLKPTENTLAVFFTLS